MRTLIYLTCGGLALLTIPMAHAAEPPITILAAWMGPEFKDDEARSPLVGLVELFAFRMRTNEPIGHCVFHSRWFDKDGKELTNNTMPETIKFGNEPQLH